MIKGYAVINNIKLESLKQTKYFYLEELKRIDLTSKQRDSYLIAKETIERIIKQKAEVVEEAIIDLASKEIKKN